MRHTMNVPCGIMRSVGKRESWAAVRRGFFILGTGLTSISFSLLQFERMMAMMRSTLMKNSFSERIFNASSKRRRWISVQ